MDMQYKKILVQECLPLLEVSWNKSGRTSTYLYSKKNPRKQALFSHSHEINMTVRTYFKSDVNVYERFKIAYESEIIKLILG